MYSISNFSNSAVCIYRALWACFLSKVSLMNWDFYILYHISTWVCWKHNIKSLIGDENPVLDQCCITFQIRCPDTNMWRKMWVGGLWWDLTGHENPVWQWSRQNVKQQLDDKRGGDGKSRVVVASDSNNSGIVKILNDGDSRTSVIVKNDGFGFGTDSQAAAASQHWSSFRRAGSRQQWGGEQCWACWRDTALNTYWKDARNSGTWIWFLSHCRLRGGRRAVRGPGRCHWWANKSSLSKYFLASLKELIKIRS